MPIDIRMPALSPTMEKGNLAKWLKKEGDTVKSGDVIAEIETDKATMEVEAVDEGTLAKILVPEGTADVPVNQVIAVLAGDGEDVKAAASGAKAESTPAAAPKAQEAKAQETKSEDKPKAAAAQATPAPQPAAARSATGESKWRDCPHLLIAAGAASREGRRRRHRADRRQRPTWPRDRARHRCGEIRQGDEGRACRRGSGCRDGASCRSRDERSADPRSV